MIHIALNYINNSPDIITMLTDTAFKTIIDKYKKTVQITNAKTLHDFIVKLDLTAEFHTCNINKVKGDIFEYIAKYYYLLKGYETYLFSEVPISLKEQLNLGKTDKGIDLIYCFNQNWVGV